jgi:hypothetical protein
MMAIAHMALSVYVCYMISFGTCNSKFSEYIHVPSSTTACAKNTAKHVPTYLDEELHIRFMLPAETVKCS